MHVHISQPCEWLDRDLAERHAITHFAEHLSDIAVEVGMRLIAKAREEDAPAGVDAVIRQGRTATHIEDPDTAAGVTPELDAIDAGAARACIDIEVGTRIARHQTGAPGVAEARIGTGEEAA